MAVINLSINGKKISKEVKDNTLLSDFIRDNLSTVPESKLEPTTIDNWGAAAKRPKDSRLTIDYDLLNALGIKINPWQDNVLKVLRELNY